MAHRFVTQLMVLIRQKIPKYMTKNLHFPKGGIVKAIAVDSGNEASE